MKFNGINVLKFIGYIVGKIFLVFLCIYAAWFALMTSFNTVNANVVVKDVFTKRTSIILAPEDNQEKELIAKICTKDYLETSGILEEDFNYPYIISSYQQRTDVPYTIILPWNKIAVYTVSNRIEDVSIAYSERYTGFDPEPYFPSGVFEVTVKRGSGFGWYVSSITLKEYIDTEFELPEIENQDAEQTEEEVIEEPTASEEPSETEEKSDT